MLKLMAINASFFLFVFSWNNSKCLMQKWVQTCCKQAHGNRSRLSRIEITPVRPTRLDVLNFFSFFLISFSLSLSWDVHQGVVLRGVITVYMIHRILCHYFSQPWIMSTSEYFRSSTFPSCTKWYCPPVNCFNVERHIDKDAWEFNPLMHFVD